MGESSKTNDENSSKCLRKVHKKLANEFDFNDPCEPALISLTADSLTERPPKRNDDCYKR